jgi:hypothetical protein
LAAAKALGFATVLLRQNTAQELRDDADKNADFVVGNVLEVGRVVEGLLSP